MEKYSTLKERFLRYVKFNTRSDEASTTVPSTPSQTEFLKDLVEELVALGYQDVRLNPKNSFVTATIPATTTKEVPVVGFIAHVDTADFEARNIQPQIHENYNGEAIVLDEEGKFVLDPKDFPNLKNYVGQTLITTNGKTLTTSLIVQLLKQKYPNILTNPTGANLTQGIVSTFLNHSPKAGEENIAVLEVDEATIRHITPYIEPKLFVFTNIFRDQMDRFGEIYTTYQLMLDGAAFAPSATIFCVSSDIFLH